MLLYAESAKADKDEYKFSVDYDVVRHEHVVLVNGKPRDWRVKSAAPRLELARFLEADRLVPITGLPAQLASNRQKERPLSSKRQKIFTSTFSAP